MTRDHTRIEELLAADALGGLDAEDRAALERERAAHGPDCAECAALEAGFADTAGRLAFALTPEPVDAAIADRVLATAPADAGRVVRLPDAGPQPDVAHRSRRWTWLAAAAAVVIVALALGVALPRSTDVQATSSQRLVSFAGETEGTLAMAYTPGEPGAVFWGSDLDVAEDRVLEVWMIEDGQAVSGGCVSPADGVVAFRVDAEIGTTDTMAITEEPSSCPATPSTPPVLTADLTIA